MLPIIVLKPVKGVVSLGLIGCRCLVFELGWSQPCVWGGCADLVQSTNFPFHGKQEFQTGRIDVCS